MTTPQLTDDGTDRFALKVGLARMLCGGVIMDVTDKDHAKIAEDAGACAVMALEKIPSDIRRDGGVARMSDPELVLAIKDTVSIPVMAKVREYSDADTSSSSMGADVRPTDRIESIMPR